MDYITLYTDFLKSHITLSKPLTIVCDSSNGPAGMIIKALQNIPNLTLISINDTPDPEFSAHGPNPLNAGATDQLAQKVLEVKADFGAIFDADGDRAFFVDEQGVMLPSFMTAVLLFKNNKAPFVADETVFKSLQHIKLFPEAEVVASKVGSYYVKQKLAEVQASVAAEFSGHYYFKDFFGADSGIFTMIQVANTLSTLDQPLSVFRNSLPPQELVNEEIKLGDKKWAEIEPKIHAYATEKGITIETREGITLDTGTSWMNMRTSNTEPIIRLIGGGTSKDELSKLIAEIGALV